eukprot:517687_1
MSASNQDSAKWIDVASCPITDFTTIPTGMNRDNYIVIDRIFASTRINCIYKYDINTNKWNKISGLNNMQNISPCSATLDVKKQIVYLFHKHSVREIQLNNSNINNYTHNTAIHATKAIVLNDSLFIVGGYGNDSILKWNPQSKTFAKFSDMYNKMRIDDFTMIYNHKNNNLLLFGGYDYDYD